MGIFVSKKTPTSADNTQSHNTDNTGPVTSSSEDRNIPAVVQNTAPDSPPPYTGEERPPSYSESLQQQQYEPPDNFPRVGDKVLAMWIKSKWQYFHATILSFDANNLQYYIMWDDQDPTGRTVDYFNLALDRSPDVNNIAVGTKVLFHQARYRGEEGVRLAGVRWHQGVIDRVYIGPSGEKLYDGHHTKGAADGKWITFKDYNYNFSGHSLDDLRLTPNVFDILGAQAVKSRSPSPPSVSHIADTPSPSRAAEAKPLKPKPVDPDACDIYLSYHLVNSPVAINNGEWNSTIPDNVQTNMHNMSDPRAILKDVESMGVNIKSVDDLSEAGLQKTVSLLKKCKLFIACVSDEYASDDRCRMEFQYAKRTMKIPIIPIVVGAGSFDWQFTVVGLLLAGELYIDFTNKDIYNDKLQELSRSVQKHIPNATDVTDISDQPHLVSSSPVKKVKENQTGIFLSYCWTNSNNALQHRQIDSVTGSLYSDPRRIYEGLKDSDMLNVWLDINHLKSADDAGMFEKIVEGLNSAAVVIVCVSTEYASSDNCRMEFQFALKSLKKPVLPVIVGEGDDWMTTVVGMLVAGHNIEAVDMRANQSEEDFNKGIQKIKAFIKEMTGADVSVENKTYHAPKLGDHVICLHQNWAYFPATVISFDKNTMEYTVDWDDGDPTGRVTGYQDVCLDNIPQTDEVAVGSVVLFPQGGYSGTEGNNTGGVRYHQGIIDRTYKKAGSDIDYYAGHHTHGGDEGKWVTYKNYSYEFSDMSLSDLRMSANAMDALMACQEVFGS